MMKTKHILFTTVLFVILALPVSAHPGKTDKYGGHYDNETGEYHYHHGYPAHEHIDGVCPYDFDDKTGQDSKPSTGTSATKKPENHIETPDPLSPVMADSGTTTLPSATKKPSTSTTSSKDNSFNWFLLLVPSAAAAGGIGYFIKNKRNKNNDIVVVNEPLALPEPKPIIPPEGYSLDENNLPYKNNREYGWGKEFNVFVTKYGKCYHRSKCNSLTPTNKKLIHRYTAINSGYKPCPHCKPKNYIDEWYKQ